MADKGYPSPWDGVCHIIYGKPDPVPKRGTCLKSTTLPSFLFLAVPIANKNMSAIHMVRCTGYN